MACVLGNWLLSLRETRTVRRNRLKCAAGIAPRRQDGKQSGTDVGVTRCVTARKRGSGFVLVLCGDGDLYQVGETRVTALSSNVLWDSEACFRFQR